MLWYWISAKKRKLSFFISTWISSGLNLFGRLCTVANLTLHCDSADRNTDSAILLSPCVISLRDTVKCRGHKSCVFTTCAVVSYLLGCPALLLLLLLILSVQVLGAFNAAVTWDIGGWCFSISRLCHRLGQKDLRQKSLAIENVNAADKWRNLTQEIPKLDPFVRGFFVLLCCALSW